MRYRANAVRLMIILKLQEGSVGVCPRFGKNDGVSRAFVRDDLAGCCHNFLQNGRLIANKKCQKLSMRIRLIKAVLSGTHQGMLVDGVVSPSTCLLTAKEG